MVTQSHTHTVTHTHIQSHTHTHTHTHTVYERRLCELNVSGNKWMRLPHVLGPFTALVSGRVAVLHTHIYTHIYTHTHARTHTHTHTHTHTRACAPIHAHHTRKHMLVHPYTPMHTRKSAPKLATGILHSFVRTLSFGNPSQRAKYVRAVC